MRSSIGVFSLLWLFVVIGCSSKEPKPIHISGEALFDGQPIPYGEVVFTPDGAKGNKGPQGIAQIRDGKYDTAAAGGKGIGGGATVIHVVGLTAQGGTVICDYEFQADLPQTTSTLKIDVPRNGAPKAEKKSRPI